MNTSSKTFRLGLVVNPKAGIGGPAAFKGSDAPESYEKAQALGFSSNVGKRVSEVLEGLAALSHTIEIVTASGEMGADYCSASAPSLNMSVLHTAKTPSTAEDTVEAARLIKAAHVDLLIFAGGDGTARDVYRAVGDAQAVLGIPAGVKMHSGVFCVTPKAAVSVVRSLLEGKLVALSHAEVRDIDESAFAQGQVRTCHYGEMLVPDDQLLVQRVKCSGLPDDTLMLDEIAAFVEETIEPGTLLVLGSGGTLMHIKQRLGMEQPTLLGVDVWYDGETLARDVNEAQLFDLVCAHEAVRVYLSVIGGQGVVLGRGNQQLSPRVLERAGLENIQFVATQERIKALNGAPLRVDTGSDQLDRALSGFHPVLCGYDDALLYEIRYLE
ncbi:MAG: ATP-NAD kinase family protein [Oleiphilaceae bacterium]|nr:ATP-NAD kinase family protein [Oleiphilaceae bacterium]